VAGRGPDDPRRQGSSGDAPGLFVGRALLGDDGRAGLDADLAIAGMGLSPPLRLRYAAQLMGAAGCGRQPGWLEVVLSWPHRIVGLASTPWASGTRM
jgi:hypothetical protein